jgi:transposase
MDPLYTCCCGLDVHKDTVVACLVRPGADGQLTKEIRSFKATTSDLLAMASWLEEAGCNHVAMESTGVYWKPVYNLLEGRFELVVANASHIKNLPNGLPIFSGTVWCGPASSPAGSKGSCGTSPAPGRS